MACTLTNAAMNVACRGIKLSALRGTSFPATWRWMPHQATTSCRTFASNNSQSGGEVVQAEKPVVPAPEQFMPFEEVGQELNMVAKAPVSSPHHSLARVHYADEAEEAINEQINVELNMSYVYTSMSNYFARDNVALHGFAHFFRESSNEEREHAHALMDFQARRGGRTRLAQISQPISEYNHPEKGDALHAMELALSMERLNYNKLEGLHGAAENTNDNEMANFVEFMLEKQAAEVKEASDYVAQLRRVGRGLGEFMFDRYLSEKHGDAAPSQSMATAVLPQT